MPVPAGGGGTAVVWAPTLDQVANYIPRRALVGAADGYGNAAGTFNADTHPTATQVMQLIADACSWVMLATGPVHESLTGAATTTAALRAAAMAELGYPDNRDDLSNGERLLEQATAMRTDLAHANEAITGQDPEDPAAHLMPVWSFPDEHVISPWGDYNYL